MWPYRNIFFDRDFKFAMEMSFRLDLEWEKNHKKVYLRSGVYYLMMIRAVNMKSGLFAKRTMVNNVPKMLFSTSLAKSNNAEDIEKVKELIEKKMAELKRAEQKRLEDEKVSCWQFELIRNRD